ncbi:MAG TPA: peptide chain release factor aRF-1 [Candidatus Nanoarchaeia archaeon]|nr:peptide chain release factor aRF-1 [Candidatus Nanoarchaeia archaeon]
MAITGAQKFKLGKLIRELETYRGRHTELVSVYVPVGYDLVKIMQHLAQEQSTASNIKSSSTRKNVMDALERMIQHLKVIGRNPPNGLAVFSGNVAEREGQSDVKVWSVEPPLPIKIRLYRCDKEFVTAPLEDLCQTKEVYALIVLDRRDGHIALLKGKTIIPLVKTHSEVMGKFRAGGQSAQRFARIREGEVNDHLKKIAEHAKESLLHLSELKGIIIGGPGPTKYDFVNDKYLTDQLQRKILAIKDLGYTEEFGLQELLERSQDILANEEVTEEKQVMQKFFTILSTKEEMTAYGLAQVKKCLELGAVETLLLSESLDDKTIEEFDELARQFNTDVKIISVETREGVQLRDIGKIAAILRYAIHQ